MFLLYERVRGRPAPVAIVNGATYAGLALLLSVMVFVLGVDLWRR
jgi:membrane-associated protease RseP (regulator of RpoE activity)